MESVYIAEGSDWYWWFGHEHSSALDDQFDLLFRKHLMNAYQTLEVNVPEYLHHQIKERRHKELHTIPWGLLDIKLDGRRSSYFEWLPAGQFDTTSKTGAVMDRSDAPDKIISRIYFGFAAKTAPNASGLPTGQAGLNFCLRIDFAMPAKAFAAGIYFVLNFLKPAKREVIIYPLDNKWVFDVVDENNNVIPQGTGLATVAVDEILEIACPIDLLGFKHKDAIEFFTEAYFALGRGDRHCDCTLDRLMVRHPDSQPSKVEVPAEDLAHIDWIA
jgi:hypothetical protein